MTRRRDRLLELEHEEATGHRSEQLELQEQEQEATEQLSLEERYARIERSLARLTAALDRADALIREGALRVMK